MKSKLGTACMILGAMLLIGALSLFLYNQWDNKRAEHASRSVLLQIEEILEQETETQGIIHPPSEPEPLPDPYDTEMTVKTVDGNDYIGYLSIPELGLELPVMSEWSYPNLKVAPCRFFGSTKTRNLIIAGHNYTSHFGALKTLDSGSLVLFTDMDDVQTRYEVIEIEILAPHEVDEMTDSGYDLTLFTCTVGGEYRVTIRCNSLEHGQREPRLSKR